MEALRTEDFHPATGGRKVVPMYVVTKKDDVYPIVIHVVCIIDCLMLSAEDFWIFTSVHQVTTVCMHAFPSFFLISIISRCLIFFITEVSSLNLEWWIHDFSCFLCKSKSRFSSLCSRLGEKPSRDE